jgi:hypothetical protein
MYSEYACGSADVFSVGRLSTKVAVIRIICKSTTTLTRISDSFDMFEKTLGKFYCEHKARRVALSELFLYFRYSGLFGKDLSHTYCCG